jgi:hypothetical protein
MENPQQEEEEEDEELREIDQYESGIQLNSNQRCNFTLILKTISPH